MDSNRAKQIIESKGVINVLYNGSPVWIESIDGNNADVTNIETKARAQVPVNMLIEG